MKKMMMIIAMMTLAISSIYGDSGKHSSEHAIIDIQNKVCPVSGQAIGSMGKGVPVVYKHKRYMLCCKGCKKAFLKNPEKHVNSLKILN